jgi:sulfur-carrier protein adenylyltransferase/sulfurtransferase
LLNTEEYQRYQKHILLPQIGEEGQLRLKSAKVLVVGAGGLGCPVLSYLTAAGVGHISIVDDDTVALSNLQRQVLYQPADIGKLKAEVAAQKLAAQNPNITLTPYIARLNTTNASQLIAAHDFVIDATDNFASRYLISDHSVLQQKPFIYGAIHRFEGQVSVFNYTDSEAVVGPSYRCLFPEVTGGIEIPNCAEIGVIGVLPGIIGCYQAMEAIKIITKVGQVLSGKLLLIDLLNNQQQVIKIQRSPNAEALAQQVLNQQPAVYTPVLGIQLAQLLIDQPSLLLLDVRSEVEFELNKLDKALNIPLSELPNSLQEIPENNPILVYCQSGKRSLKAIEILQKAGIKNPLYNLEKGLNT